MITSPLKTLSVTYKAIAFGITAVTIILATLPTPTLVPYSIFIANGLFCPALASISDHLIEQ